LAQGSSCCILVKLLKPIALPHGLLSQKMAAIGEMRANFQVESQASHASAGGSEAKLVTFGTITKGESFLRPEGNAPGQPPLRQTGAWVEMGLFVLFIATRAFHPAIMDNAKEVVIDKAGKEVKKALYANMTPVMGECIVTVIIGQVMALCIGGIKAWKSIWTPAPLMVFSCIGIMYAWGDILEVLAMTRMSGDVFQVLLQSKLLMTAIMMRYFKGTKTSRLQWIILAVVMTAMSVYSTAGSAISTDIDKMYDNYTVAEYRNATHHLKEDPIDDAARKAYLKGICLVVAKVVVSCLCAVLSDKYMKDYKDVPIYVQLVQFKIAWLIMTVLFTFSDDLFFEGKTWTAGGPLKNFHGGAWLVLVSFTVRGWVSLCLLKILDSVLKNIGETASVMVTFMLQIYVFHEKVFNLELFLMVLVVTLAVMSYIDSKAVVDKARKYDEATPLNFVRSFFRG